VFSSEKFPSRSLTEYLTWLAIKILLFSPPLTPKKGVGLSTYDRRFRLKASATTVPEWSSIDITMWRMAFPARPPVMSTYPNPKPLLYKPSLQSFSSSLSPQRVCLEWNENPNPECLRPLCKFDHVCYRCVHTNVSNKKHKEIFCPYKQKRLCSSSNIPEKGPQGLYNNP